MAKKKGKPKAGLVLRGVATTGGLELTADEERRVQVAARQVERMVRRSLVAVSVELSEFIVREFFHGDLVAARSRTRKKPPAYLRLLEVLEERSDVAPSAVRRALALSAQYYDLPVGLRERLTLSQHYSLQAVEKLDDKVRIGELAVEKNLSKRAIDELVRATVKRHAGGRPPQAAVEKAVAAARRALVSSLIESQLSVPQMKKLGTAVREDLRRDLRAIRERCERITDVLDRVK